MVDYVERLRQSGWTSYGCDEALQRNDSNGSLTKGNYKMAIEPKRDDYILLIFIIS